MSSTVETISLGCRLNAYETERMAALARNTEGGRSVIINTCAVTNEAVRQSRQAIRRARKDHPDARIVVSGCAAELDKDGFSAMPEVDHLIGNPDKLSPAAWASRDNAPLSPSSVEARAPLKIQNGCDHQCTFCIIPMGRGAATSRPSDELVEEAQRLVEAGAKEIVLTGVDLTSYGPDLGPETSLSDPLEALLKALPATIRIRLSSIDGAEIDDRLFDLVTTEHRVMPHLHLSLQSGDPMILKRMKRRHSRADAIDLCERLHKARPDIAIGADLIAGFPTETDDMFANSLSLVSICNLSYVHVFPFSPRTGTPAAKMPQVPRDTVKHRASSLRAAADKALAAHLAKQVGSIASVLIEHSDGTASFGKLPNFTDVTLPHALPKGSLQRIKIIGTQDHRLTADLHSTSGPSRYD